MENKELFSAEELSVLQSLHRNLDLDDDSINRLHKLSTEKIPLMAVNAEKRLSDFQVESTKTQLEHEMKLTDLSKEKIRLEAEGLYLKKIINNFQKKGTDGTSLKVFAQHELSKIRKITVATNKRAEEMEDQFKKYSKLEENEEDKIKPRLEINNSNSFSGNNWANLGHIITGISIVVILAILRYFMS